MDKLYYIVFREGHKPEHVYTIQLSRDYPNDTYLYIAGTEFPCWKIRDSKSYRAWEDIKLEDVPIECRLWTALTG